MSLMKRLNSRDPTTLPWITHPKICTGASTPLFFDFLNMRSSTMATSKSFSSVASNVWNALPNHLSSIPTLPAFRRALKHHLFLLAYPDSSAKSGKIKPVQCITLRDTAPTTATAPPGNTMPPI